MVQTQTLQGLRQQLSSNKCLFGKALLKSTRLLSSSSKFTVFSKRLKSSNNINNNNINLFNGDKDFLNSSPLNRFGNNELKNNQIPSNLKFIQNNQDLQRPEQSPLQMQKDIQMLQDAIIEQQSSKQKKTAFYSFIIIILGSFFGYTICYRVLYLQEETYWPLYPVSSVKTISTIKDINDNKIDVESIYELATQKVLYNLQMNEYIKSHYQIPLRVSRKDTNTRLDDQDLLELFDKLWLKDTDTDVFTLKVIQFRPYDPKFTEQGYVSVGKLIQFKVDDKFFTSLKKIWNNILGNEEIYQLINERKDKSLQETEDDEIMMYKYDPSTSSKELELCFLNEFTLLEDDASIIYKGKCNHNCDITITQIDLVTKDGKRKRYVLYKDGDSK